MKYLIERSDKHLLMAAGWQVIQVLEDAGKYPMFLCVSGSHSFGLEQQDSDIDIRGVYLDPTERVLSLVPVGNSKSVTSDTLEGHRGSIDYQVYEFGKFLSMLLANNGNVVRLLLSPYVLYSETSIPWEELGRKYLTKSLRLYYRGYADSQRKRAMKQRGGKALIYTYREIFDGIAVMALGRPIWDFKELWEWISANGYYEDGLLHDYFHDPEMKITDMGWHRFYAEWEELCKHLDFVAERSDLPEEYNGFDELNSLLYKWRLKGLFLPEIKLAYSEQPVFRKIRKEE